MIDTMETGYFIKDLKTHETVKQTQKAPDIKI